MRTQGIGFTIGAKRISPLRPPLSGNAKADRRNPIDTTDAQVAVPDDQPAD